MKKLLALLVMVAMLLPACQKIEDRIDGLENRIDQIEGTQIATINQQIEAINTTLPQLRETDAELKEYIQSLQTTATNLQEQITNTNKDIDELEAALDQAIADAEASDDALKAELVAQLNTAKADILAQLESTKTALEAELAQINSTIATLQAKDTELEGKITTLEEYVNTELQNTEDWAIATFATLEQYNSIASDIATIKQNIESLNSSIEALEERLTESIAEEIAAAIEPIKDELVAEVISGIASDYMAAISTAKSEITAAYTSAIATSISNLESSMREWVNEQLTGYYTIAETDALLALLKSELEGDLASQKSYVEGLINTLSNNLTSQISANKILIDALRNDMTTAEGNIADNAEAISENSSKILANAEAIAENSDSITDNTSAILANATEIENLNTQINNYKQEMAATISEIESHLTDLDADIDNINEQIEAVRNDYTSKIAALQSAMEQLISANTALINANKQSIENNAAAIAENKTAIAALKASTDSAIAKNAADIATNAENIANNAALIAQNATAINNNANAIAQNTASILQLQQDLADAKVEITAAYKAAISTAITTLDGELRDKIAAEVTTINSRIDNEVATINNTIAALTERVTALEKEVKTIKVAIYNIQSDIADIQEQIAAILARIQSISYVPEYNDGNATMYYTNSAGVITAGTATLKYEFRPASCAEEVAEVWESALNVKAVYTQTRAAGDFVALGIESVEAANGFLTVVVSGSNLSESYFRGEISANVRLEVSNGYNDFTSDYVNIVPWTTDTIYIPDANFKAYLTTEFDTNGDNEISLEEAQSITNIDISASLLQVKSLAGIEYFSNLETLDCSFNRITSLDLSSNTKLTDVNVGSNKLTSLLLPTSVTAVDASNNKLTTLDVSVAKNLTTLNVANNTLGSLNVAQNKALVELNCTGNDIATLNLTNLLLLEELYCGGNNLAALNVTKNTALTALECNDNDLTALDLTKNAALVTLNCRDNQLPSIHLGSNLFTDIDCANNQLNNLNVSAFTKLKSLDCSHNNIATLDVAKCAAIETLNCSYNNITSLNVSTNSQLKTLDCSNNAPLAKLWVKDSAQQGAIDITKDDATNIYFNNGGLVIPDTALKAYLVNNYDDDGDGEISIAESDNITMINCSGKGVADLTGLEACTNLTSLNCSNNTITHIYLPSLTKLKSLTIFDNPIEEINLNNDEALEYLYIENASTNAVRTDETGKYLSIEGYIYAPNLTLSISNAGIYRLDIPSSTTLQALNVTDNDFVVFNCYENTALTSVLCPPTVEKLIANGCSMLESINVSHMLNLTELNVSDCTLTSLDVTKNLSLIKLMCSNNNLAELNIRQNTVLEYLSCSDNAISSLYLKNNTNLNTLYAERISIEEINLSNNHMLTNVNLKGNANLKTIILWDECTATCNDYLHHDVAASIQVVDTDGVSYGYPYYIGQYIPYCNGGVVFESTNEGKNCKLVSVDETNSNWGAAKHWCSNYATDWYLPTKDELQAIYDVKDILNATLSANGYTAIGTGLYWSSTEGKYYTSVNYYYIGAYILSFSNGDWGTSLKDTTHNVRSVVAF